MVEDRWGQSRLILAATGEPAQAPRPGEKTKFHRDKAVDIVNRFMKLKSRILKDKILNKKQKKKLFRAIDVQANPLRKLIKAFDKSPLTRPEHKKHKLQPDVRRKK